MQVHCAHGYLLAQALSLNTNKRTDEYGGDLEGRSRILFKVIEQVRRRVPDPSCVICVKINSVEFQPGGQTPEDCRNLCVKMEQARVDFIDLSGERRSHILLAQSADPSQVGLSKVELASTKRKAPKQERATSSSSQKCCVPCSRRRRCT